MLYCKLKTYLSMSRRFVKRIVCQMLEEFDEILYNKKYNEIKWV